MDIACRLPSSNHQPSRRRKSIANGAGQGDYCVRHVKLVVFTILSFLQSREAGLAAGKCESTCTRTFDTYKVVCKHLSQMRERIRVGSICATTQLHVSLSDCVFVDFFFYSTSLVDVAGWVVGVLCWACARRV